MSHNPNAVCTAHGLPCGDLEDAIVQRDRYRDALGELISCVLTIKANNTPDWMAYIAEEVNRAAEAMGDADRVQVAGDGLCIIRAANEQTTLAPDVINTPGADALSEWFSLSYAGFLTIPRVLMEAMPDVWQCRMAALLNEYSETWTEWPAGMSSRVQILVDGKLVRTPDWMKNYRHPDERALETLKAPASVLQGQRGEA
nr:hypothetical protein [uncultured Holophaga sp.]